MIKAIADFENVDLSDHALVLPAVSVGNVGQLAVDLLITNLPNSIKVGRIFHPGLEPVVGNEISEAGEVSLMTSCECFHDGTSKLFIIQFHAPVLSRCTEDFVELLIKWIKQKNFQLVVCLSSTFASERIDSQLVGPPFRYLNSSSLNSTALERLKSSGWTKLEGRQFPAPPVYARVEEKADGEIYVPGSGITKVFLASCETKQIPLAVFLMFVSEGDNTQDSIAYFQAANQIFGWVNDKRTPKIPPSWIHLFGAPHPPEIY